MTNARSFKINRNKLLILFIWIGLFPTNLFSNNNISFDFRQIYLQDALDTLVSQYNISLAYPDIIENPLINVSCNQCTDDDAVETILKNQNLSWEKKSDQYVIFADRGIFKFSVSGSVLDSLSNEPIPFANIFNSSLSIGEISDQNGQFSVLNISTKTCTLNISYIGYKTKRVVFSFLEHNNEHLKINLNPKILASKAVSITGYNKEFMGKSESTGQISFSPKHIAILPHLGEIDIFRSLQFLPGIQLGNSGTSGLYVRGGTPDQNLILLDGMKIFYTSHMFGFLSSISPDAVKNIQVYKGNIPSEFGGSLSSVIKLTTRNGNGLKPHFSYHSNFMSNGLSLESPISSRINFIVNIRKSTKNRSSINLYDSITKYVNRNDQFNLLSESANSQINKEADYSIANSYEDLISRISFLASPRHRFSFTKLYGNDIITENRKYWGFNNILAHDSIRFEEKSNWTSNGESLNWSSKWNQSYSSDFLVSNYIFSSNYNSIQKKSNNTNSPLFGFAIEKNSLKNRSMKYNHKFKGFKNHTISASIEESLYKIYFANDLLDGGLSNQTFIKQTTYLSATSIEDNWIINHLLKLKVGHRLSYHSTTEQFYSSPRLALSFIPKKNINFEISFNKLNQFIHQLNNVKTTRGNQNMWLMSSDVIPVMTSNNINVGSHLKNKNYNITLNGYHKLLKNLFQLKDPFYTSLSLNKKDEIESIELDKGSGVSKGIELLIRKNKGFISGWISYQLNQSTYRFEGLNSGNLFLANHDKTHELKTIIMTRIFNWDISSMWAISSGGVYTSDSNIYVGSGFQLITNDNKNIARLPATHRLDVSFSKSLRVKSSTIELGLSIYNLYNKKNIDNKKYNPYDENLTITDVFMFGFTPTFFLKARI